MYQGFTSHPLTSEGFTVEGFTVEDLGAEGFTSDHLATPPHNINISLFHSLIISFLCRTYEI